MGRHAAVVASLCLSGTLAVILVFARGAITKEKALEPEAGSAPAVYEREAFYPPSAGGVLAPLSAVPVWNHTLSLYEVHEGEDYFCTDGKVLCASDGRVEEIFTDDRYGLTVRVAHDGGAETVYASLSKAHVKTGQSVKAGQVIALSGDSARCEKEMGEHVHFEYRVNGVSCICPFASGEDS